MKVTISRKHWLTGPESKLNSNSALYNVDENQYWKACCLGHAISQICEVPIEELKLKSTPLDSGVTNLPDFLVEKKKLVYPSLNRKVYTKEILTNSVFSMTAMEINDNSSISQFERETKLITLFKENGITLEFVD